MANQGMEILKGDQGFELQWAKHSMEADTTLHTDPLMVRRDSMLPMVKLELLSLKANQSLLLLKIDT